MWKQIGVHLLLAIYKWSVAQREQLPRSLNSDTIKHEAKVSSRTNKVQDSSDRTQRVRIWKSKLSETKSVCTNNRRANTPFINLDKHLWYNLYFLLSDTHTYAQTIPPSHLHLPSFSTYLSKILYILFVVLYESFYVVLFYESIAWLYAQRKLHEYTIIKIIFLFYFNNH